MSKVPIIDIRAFLEGGKDANPRRALDTACRDHGFFLLTGHGMDDLIDAAWAETRAFFASPKMLKRSVERSRDNALGYFDRELTKQKRDRKEVFDFADDNQDTSGTGFGRSRWPQDLPEFRTSLHRVLPVPGRDRYSIVYFSMPRHDALIAPAPALYDGVPEYRAFAWTEFISGRLGDNFADYGVDDIQISDFRIG